MQCLPADLPTPHALDIIVLIMHVRRLSFSRLADACDVSILAQNSYYGCSQHQRAIVFFTSSWRLCLPSSPGLLCCRSRSCPAFCLLFVMSFQTYFGCFSLSLFLVFDLSLSFTPDLFLMISICRDHILFSRSLSSSQSFPRWQSALLIWHTLSVSIWTSLDISFLTWDTLLLLLLSLTPFLAIRSGSLTWLPLLVSGQPRLQTCCQHHERGRQQSHPPRQARLLSTSGIMCGPLRWRRNFVQKIQSSWVDSWLCAVIHSSIAE